MTLLPGLVWNGEKSLNELQRQSETDAPRRRLRPHCRGFVREYGENEDSYENVKRRRLRSHTVLD